MNLGNLPIARSARVVVLRLDEAEARFVRAVGIFEQEEIMVLRRAPFGGPLHLRTSSGGEFALDRTLAMSIEVEPMPAREPIKSRVEAPGARDDDGYEAAE
jgi:ferrous iron transport protein A